MRGIVTFFEFKISLELQIVFVFLFFNHSRARTRARAKDNIQAKKHEALEILESETDQRDSFHIRTPLTDESKK